MAITSLVATLTSLITGYLTSASDLDDPTFYIWRDGVLVGATKSTRWSFTLEAGEFVVWDVFDDSATVPAAAFPGRVTVTWCAVETANHYRVEQWGGATWDLQIKILDRGEGYFSWESGFLEDVTEHKFRVVPIAHDRDAQVLGDGNIIYMTELRVLMVRHPDIPDFSAAWNGSGDPTITVAIDDPDT